MKDCHNRNKQILLQNEGEHGNKLIMFIGRQQHLQRNQLRYPALPDHHVLSNFALIVLSFLWLRRLGLPSADYIAISSRMAIKGSSSVVKRDNVYSIFVHTLRFIFIYLLTVLSPTAQIILLQKYVSCNCTFMFR